MGTGGEDAAAAPPSWTDSVVRELRELYQLELEAASCYEQLGEARSRNRALEAQLERAGVNGAADSGDARPIRLDAIVASSSDSGPVEYAWNVDAPASPGGEEAWVSSLPLRFKRELELKDAYARIEDLEGKVAELKSESNDLSGIVHDNARRSKDAEDRHSNEKAAWQYARADMEESIAELEREKSRLHAINAQMDGEQDVLRASISELQQLVFQHKERLRDAETQRAHFETDASAKDVMLANFTQQLEEMKGRGDLQSEQLQAVIESRNQSDRERLEALESQRAMEQQKTRLERQVQTLRKQMRDMKASETQRKGKEAKEAKEAEVLKQSVSDHLATIAERDKHISELESKIEGMATISDSGDAEREGDQAKDEMIAALKKKESEVTLKLRAAVRKGKTIEQRYQEVDKELKSLKIKFEAAESTAAQEGGSMHQDAAIMQGRISDLEGQLEQAQKTASQSDEHAAKAAAMQGRIAELEGQLEHMRESVGQSDEHAQKAAAMQRRIAELESQLDKVEKIASQSEEHAENALAMQGRISELENQVQHMRESAVQSEEHAAEAAAMRDLIAQLKGQLATQLEHAQKSAGQSEGHAQRAAEMQGRIADLEAQLKQAEETAKESEEHAANVAGMQGRIAELEGQLVQIQESASQSDEHADKTAAMQDRIAELESQLDNQREQAQDSASQSEEHARNAAAMQGRIADLEGQLEHMRESVGQSDEHAQKAAAMQGRIAELESQLEQAQEKEREKEKERASMDSDGSAHNDAPTLANKAKDWEDKHKKTTVKLHAAVSRGKKFQARLHEKEQECAALQKQHAALERELSTLRVLAERSKQATLQAAARTTHENEIEEGGEEIEPPPASLRTPAMRPMVGLQQSTAGVPTATAAAVGDGAPWSNDGVGEWGAVEAAGTESTKEGTKEGPKEGAKEGPKDFKELLGGDSDNDEDDLKIDQAIKSTATSLWNFVLGD